MCLFSAIFIEKLLLHFEHSNLGLPLTVKLSGQFGRWEDNREYFFPQWGHSLQFLSSWTLAKWWSSFSLRLKVLKQIEHSKGRDVSWLFSICVLSRTLKTKVSLHFSHSKDFWPAWTILMWCSKAFCDLKNFLQFWDSKSF